MERQVTSTEWAGRNRQSAYRRNPETKWVLAAQAGYALAFEELVTRYECRIYRLALRITQNQKDAEDVLLDTFVKAYEHLREFQLDSCLSHWLVRIAATEALRKLRERYPAEVDLDQLEQTDHNSVVSDLANWCGNPEERFTQSELKQILFEGINTLKPMSRIVFLLRDTEKCSAGDVADFLGLSWPAVASRLLRARLEMRQHLNRYFKRGNDPVPSSTTLSRGKQKELDNERTIGSTAT
jgi:RNA polymerase sigma-70 factor (ECF subfamily)